MSAGTLTLTNNSAAVMGSGTVFNNDLAAGDFIVVKAGGVTYTLPVKTIESNTALTLARNYNGPAIAAGAWTAMPRDTLNLISAQIAADTAYAIRQRVLEIDNWYQLLEVNGDVTIKMADGSSYTGPSWLSVVSQTGNLSALGIGGTGTALAALDWQKFDFVPGARYNVVSGNMTNVPADMEVPFNNYGTIIEVSGYDGNNTKHVEVWFSTTSTTTYRRYQVRVTGPVGSRTYRTRRVWGTDDVIPLASLALSDIGINSTGMPTIANVDWQQVALVSGTIQIWNCANWLNAPAGLPTTSLIVAEVIARSGTRASVNITAFNAGANRRVWNVSVDAAGTPGSRTFNVLEIMTSGNPTPVTAGGTGATTAGAARTALGVAYGSIAGTVAQGDDSRLNTLDGKTGGVVSSAIFTLGDGQVVRSKKNADGSWPTTTPSHAVLLDNRVPNAGQPGGWFGMNMTENVGVDCYGSLYLQAAGVNKTWLFAQNGNAISPGSWVPNSDGRLKRKKERIEDPLGKMTRLGGYTWMRIDTDSWGIGFISQEVADVFPEAISIGPDRELPDGSVVEGVQSPDTYGVAAALHHESILQLMDIMKGAITTIAGVTTDESAKAALEALAERIPPSNPS